VCARGSVRAIRDSALDKNRFQDLLLMSLLEIEFENVVKLCLKLVTFFVTFHILLNRLAQKHSYVRCF